MSKLKKDGTPRSSGSGRTKGAVSLVSIKVKDLTAKFDDEDIVVIGRIFAQKAGLADKLLPAIKDPITDKMKAGVTVVTI